MKTMTKRTAVAALTGVMAVGMLTGCGEKKLDGTKQLQQWMEQKSRLES